MATKVKVYCKTLNKWFGSIKSAAQFAKVDDWTMSRKMDVLGSFVDKYGNEYERSEPMITKNKYNEITKIVKTHKIKKRTVKNKEEKPTNISFGDYPKPVQDLIIDKIKDMMAKRETWGSIKDFMKKTGCKALTIRVDDEK